MNNQITVIQLTDYQGSLFRRFTGKEKDSESGYYYFGARYFMPTLSIWNSVDPMADKYPSLSPYNYCAWNPMKLVDPDGEEIEFNMDWYRNKNGNMIWRAEHREYIEVNGEKYNNVGLTYTNKLNNTYYSLFGQTVNGNSKNGKITKQIDEAFINYANFCEQDKNYKWSIYNTDGPRRYSTDFSNILKFDNGRATTSGNQHYPNEMGTYAGVADVYFFVTGKNMEGVFVDWHVSPEISGGNGQLRTPKGVYLTIGQEASRNNTIIGLNFKNNGSLEKFKSNFWKLFPQSAR
jgi:RHS repeat-associated protein